MRIRPTDGPDRGPTDTGRAAGVVPIELKRETRPGRSGTASRRFAVGEPGDTLARAALDLVQASSLDGLLEDFGDMVGEVVDAGNVDVFFVERESADPSRWELVDTNASVLLVSLNLLLERRASLWQLMSLGRHVEIGAGRDPILGSPAAEDDDEEQDLRSYILLVPLLSRSQLEAVLCLEVPDGKPKPSPVQLLHLRQLCQMAGAPLARLREMNRLREERDALRAENAALRDSSPASSEPPAREAAAAIAAKVKSRIFANFAHDLGTPAVAIVGYTRMVLEGRAGTINSTQREYLEIVAENAGRLVNLVHSMNRPIYYTDLDLESLDVLALWRERRSRVDGRARAKSITIRENAPDGPYSVIADREKLTEIFDKLLANSLNFTNPGGTITVGFERNNRGEIVVAFSDSGVGIAGELLERILSHEPSKRMRKRGIVETSDDLQHGLTMVRDNVRGQGGRVWARGGSGEGPTFELALLSSGDLWQPEGDTE